MSIDVTSEPAFRHYQHLPAGADPTKLLGDGGFDSVDISAVDLETLSGIRRIKCGGVSGGWTLNVTGLMRKVVIGFLHNNNGNSQPGYIGFSAGGTLQMNLATSGGVIQVRRGTTVLATPLIWNDGVDRYIEFAVNQDDVSGSWELRADGVTVASGSGDTQASDDDIDVIKQNAGTIFGGNDHQLAYMYFKAWDGASDPGFLGPIAMTEIGPTSDVSAVWMPDSGATNYTQVTSPDDGDSSYVETSNDNDVDQYGLSNIPTTGDVIAVVPFAVAKASSGGAPPLRLGLDDGTSDYGPSRTLSASGYRTVWGKTHTTLPGGGALTPTGVNGLDLLLDSYTP